MVIVRLKGGIGNQLFQFAFGRAVSLLRKEELYFDLTYLTENPLNFIPRDFKLGFMCNYELTDNMTIGQFNTWHKQGETLIIGDDFPKNKIVNALIDKNIQAVLLDGYYQEEFYFLGYHEEIRKEVADFLNYHYELSDIKSELLDGQLETVGVHIRRGDYVLPQTLKVHGICEAEYYLKALKLIKSKFSNPHFYLFTDDVKAADEMFAALLTEGEFTNISGFIKGTGFNDQDLIELSILKKCRHFILANSSFSWWGSYLSDQRGKTVVAPQEWYQDKKLKSLSDAISLPGWIRI